MFDIRKFFSNHYKIVGRLIIAFLVCLNIFQLYHKSFQPVVNIISILLLQIPLFVLANKNRFAQNNEQLAESVIELSGLILKVESREELLDEIIKEVVYSVPNGNKGSIITVDKNKNLTFDVVLGYELDAVRQIDIQFKDTILFRETDGALDKSVLINDIMEYNRETVSKDTFENMEKAGIDQIKATISSPISLDGQFIGMINIDSLDYRGFNSADVELVEKYSKEISKIIGLYQIFEKKLKTAKYDSLTNALNRPGFIDIITRLAEDDETENFTICYMDLDKLKAVNDQYGHNVGDKYIIRLVDGINAQLKGEETVSRFGGDEFVALLFRTKEEIEQLHSDADDWFKKHPIKVKGDNIEVKFSYGSASYPEDGKNIMNLINKADARMYQQKKSKRSK